MAGGWGSELTGLFSLALVIALSPLSIIPAVLILQTPRPRPSSLAFLGGWLLALAALTALFVSLSGLLGGLHKSPPVWASWLRIVVGAALIVVGVIRWLTRHRHTDAPRWMRSLANLTPGRAAITGALLAVVRLEVLLLCAAAGLVIGSAGLGLARAWTAAAFFVAVAASTVAIPVLAYAAAGDRLDDPLARLQDWMERHNAEMLAALLLVMGLLVLYKGIHGI
ncbi:membrane protein [Mycobacterium sp. MFM001]|uniref:GAP family protein n=1 Tax=Mycobacterium sp. MFM001 TaxID=2049453 RepID=UPI000DA51FE9|nr:GAP family protein [Mycobacterium sp. MFM001]GBE63543.1 membrane protein [Mycobacterium sp. MFM001]